MTVLAVGPHTVRVLSGPGGPVEPELVEAALYWIDDPVGLYQERPVAVAELWRAVMAAVIGAHRPAVVLVHPDDWSRYRVERVVAAANAVADDVTAVPSSRFVDEGGDDPIPDRVPRRRRHRLRTAGPALAAGSAVLVAGAALAGHSPRLPEPGPPAGTTTVVEGRIAVRMPQSWIVTRVTGGPGSRRLQMGPPADREIAVHLTQAYAPESTVPDAAAVLGRLIADQPPGVFVDFRADGQFAGRPAVTYREVRAGWIVDWSVLQVGATRIGVGCQSPPGRTAAVREVCLQAATSVRESGTDPLR